MSRLIGEFFGFSPDRNPASLAMKSGSIVAAFAYFGALVLLIHLCLAVAFPDWPDPVRYSITRLIGMAVWAALVWSVVSGSAFHRWVRMSAVPVCVAVLFAQGSVWSVADAATERVAREDAAVPDTADEKCDLVEYADHFANWPAAHPNYDGPMHPMPDDSVDFVPKRLLSPPPDYPAWLKSGADEPSDGWVLLEVVVEPNGRVEFVEALDAYAWRPDQLPSKPRTPSARRVAQPFVESAIRMMKRSVFSPGIRNGARVATVVCIPIEFKLTQR